MKDIPLSILRITCALHLRLLGSCWFYEHDTVNVFLGLFGISLAGGCSVTDSRAPQEAVGCGLVLGKDALTKLPRLTQSLYLFKSFEKHLKWF